jgi:hypothetical protein
MVDKENLYIIAEEHFRLTYICFCSHAVEVSVVLLGCSTTSLDDQCLVSWDNIMVLSSRVKISINMDKTTP